MARRENGTGVCGGCLRLLRTFGEANNTNGQGWLGLGERSQITHMIHTSNLRKDSQNKQMKHPSSKVPLGMQPYLPLINFFEGFEWDPLDACPGAVPMRFQTVSQTINRLVSSIFADFQLIFGWSDELN